MAYILYNQRSILLRDYKGSNIYQHICHCMVSCTLQQMIKVGQLVANTGKAFLINSTVMFIWGQNCKLLLIQCHENKLLIFIYHRQILSRCPVYESLPVISFCLVLVSMVWGFDTVEFVTKKIQTVWKIDIFTVLTSTAFYIHVVQMQKKNSLS